MIHVLLSQPGCYTDIVDHLAARGARVTVVGPPRRRPFGTIEAKRDIVLGMLSPALLRTRRLWAEGDRILVIGWQALPILCLVRLGLLAPPARLAIMACFVHGARPRRIVNWLWSLLQVPAMEVIAFSPGEARNLIEQVRMPPDKVHVHVFRQPSGGVATGAAQHDDGSIFAGGYSNRDYEMLMRAVAPMAAPLVIVASSMNRIEAPSRDGIVVHRDLPEDAFETLLARSRVVAMPLRSEGEACGQSVLLRVLRNGKPLIVTRHESIVAYLGKDYPGYVEPGSVQSLRDALQRALHEDAYLATLARLIRRAHEHLAQQGSAGEEIAALLECPVVGLDGTEDRPARDPIDQTPVRRIDDVERRHDGGEQQR